MRLVALVLLLTGCAAPQLDPITQARMHARRDFVAACVAYHDPAPEVRIMVWEQCQILARRRIK